MVFPFLGGSFWSIWAKWEKYVCVFKRHEVEYPGERKEPMKKNWIGLVVLIGVSMAAGQVLSQMWEQVLGQTGTFAVGPPAQVVVNQPIELSKYYVNSVILPPLQGENLPRIQLLTVVDMELKRIAAYHMDMLTGDLKLLTVRDIHEDLMVNQYNALPPLPSALKQERQRLEAEKKENR